MKLNHILFFSALLSLTVVFTSCKDNTGDDESGNGVSAEEAEQMSCTHSLIHVDALAPTGEENGCIEHYECELCGAIFSDAAGENAIDNIIIWATNYGNPNPDENPVFDNAGVYEDNGKWKKFADEKFITENLFCSTEDFRLGLSKMAELTEFAKNSHIYRQQILDEAERIPDPQYHQAIDKLRSRQNSIASTVDECFLLLMEHKDIIDNPDSCQLDSIKAIYKLLERFNIGDVVKIILYEYISFQGNGSLKSYPAYYDYVAKHTPDVMWEHQSYQLRENARAADATLMYEYYTLFAAYNYIFEKEKFEMNMSKFNNAMTDFAKVLKDNPIEYHSDVIISCIPGLNKTFRKKLNTVAAWDVIYKHRDEYLWPMDNVGDRLEDIMLEMNNNEEYIDQSVYKTIYDYYKQRYIKADINEILRNAGFSNVEGWLVANRKEEKGKSARSDDYDCVWTFYIFRWQIGFKKNEDWLGICTCLQSNCELCYTNVIVDANILRNDGRITNMGKRCNVTFCSLIEVK